MNFTIKYNKYVIKNKLLNQKGGLAGNDKIIYNGYVATVALIENGRVYISYDNDPAKNIFEITMKQGIEGSQDISLAAKLVGLRDYIPPADVIHKNTIYIQKGTVNRVYVTDITDDRITYVPIIRFISKRDFNVDDSQIRSISVAIFNTNFTKIA
jgi:hypothetical protein